jgi:carboxylesterase type B
MTDKDYICSARRVLSALSRNQTEFVGRFLFNHGLASGPFARYGATHGLEMFFIFDTVEATAVNPQTADDRVLVKAFQTTWSIFARTGTAPNSWDRYDVANDNYRILNTPMSSGDHLRKTQCDFWDLQPAP